jgi:hypothetical protein
LTVYDDHVDHNEIMSETIHSHGVLPTSVLVAPSAR